MRFVSRPFLYTVACVLLVLVALVANRPVEAAGLVAGVTAYVLLARSARRGRVISSMSSSPI